MMNFVSIYLFSVLLLMGFAIIHYDRILFSLGMQMNEDKSFLGGFELEDTPENRVKVANTLIFISAVFAPIVLIYFLASELADKNN